MDNFCTMVSRILHWVDRTEAPGIPWIGQAGSRLNNPPAGHIEIVYVLKGGMDNIWIGDKPASIPTGSVGIYNVHQGNRSSTDLPDLLVWCLFLDVSGIAAFKDLERNPFFACVPVMEQARLQEMFETLTQRCAALQRTRWSYPTGADAYGKEAKTGHSEVSRMFIKTALLELLACVLEEGERAGGNAADLPVALQRTIEHITLNYANPDIHLDQLAGAARLSVDHLGRLFRQHLGTSPMHYLQRIRIDRSRFLLTHTDLYVEEISTEIGFRDPFYFSRVFKKQNGKSPSQYRDTTRTS